MERLACVDVAALPLQILLRAHPDWRTLPAAVVEADRPHAPVLYVNAPARRAGVRAGQRYHTALAIERHLRAGVVARAEVDDGLAALVDRLRRHAPRVEAATTPPGVFWLDVGGFDRLHPSLAAWAEAMRADVLSELELQASVAVGFSRFGVYALAISRRGVVVCASPDEEHAAVQQVPLARIDLEPDVRDRLHALGIDTVGGFLALPGKGIRARFGAGVDTLHQLAAGRREVPLAPVLAPPSYERTVDFDTAADDAARLLFAAKRLVDGLLAALAPRGLAVRELDLHLRLDDRTSRVERVSPAAPTLDVVQLLALVRLRLETLRLSAGVVAMRIAADASPATADARRLFALARREAAAANQALARLRAECGEPNVVRARLRDAHLPTARFAWEPMPSVPEQAAPRVVADRPLVRRIHTRPQPLAASQAPDVIVGPYVVSGGWWADGEGQGVRRDYGFALAAGGELQWLYYDHQRRRFFVQGRVE